jgi:peptide/nickel transport system permease protein
MSLGLKWREFRAGMGPRIAEWKFMLKRLSRSSLAVAGLAIIAGFIVMACCAPLLAPPTSADPFTIPKDEELSFLQPNPVPPVVGHIFGTTDQQYDLYYACIWGSITAFRIGVFVVAVSLAIGIAVGTLGAFYGGMLDEVLMRFTDIIIAFPGLVLSMALVLAFPTSVPINISSLLILFSLIMVFVFAVARINRRVMIVGLAVLSFSLLSLFYFPITLNVYLTNLDKVLVAITIVGWPGYARVIRGEVLRVKNEDYVEASRASGSSDMRTIVKHILPNGIYPLLIVATLDIGSIVLSAAALSFLGLGAAENFADWGQIISRSRNWITDANLIVRNFHTFFIPGLFITTFVVGWNLLGDALRDVLDPMLRRR